MIEVEINNEAVRRAVAAAGKHPQVGEVGRVIRHEEGGGATVDITFNVALPNEWRTAGESPNTGVRLAERVRFDFPREFPVLAPAPSLRPDFSRSLPHMQPYITRDGRPVPCIYDGDLAELLHQQGWRGVLDHTAVWLDRAATANLIDAEQGWEPVRRDWFRDYVVADANSIQQVVNRQGGMMFRRAFYFRTVLQNGAESVYSRILPERMQVNKDKAHIFAELPASPDKSAFIGKSLAILVWPGKHPSGDLVVNDTYLPETVSSVRELCERAQQYGCLAQLNDALGILRKALAACPPRGPFKLLLVLLARRPFHLIGSHSNVELCPYVVDVRAPKMFANGPSTPVCPAAHRHEISRDLLARMTGESSLDVTREWTLLGAGSLGSKIAVHLARAGHGPRVVVDRSALSPHNAARHGLLPPPDDSQCLWMRDKAVALCDALRALSREATPFVEDVVKMVRSEASCRRLGKKPWAVLNATASLTVQEALAATEVLPKTRIIETSLFAGGRVGVVTVEGSDRSPNTADLMAECYRLLATDAPLAKIVFGEGGGSWQRVGQGCGSSTMAMSDGRLSLFAAAMAEYLLSRQRGGLPDNHGEVLLGQLLDDGLGLTWRSIDVEPTTTVRTDNGRWRIRIGQFAKRKIEEEVRRWQGVETGGVLIGRLSEPSRSAHIVDVLSAPEDSVRSRRKFVLGVKGLRPLIQRYTKSVDGALYCVGTWHNHLVPSGPSLIDKATARSLSLVEASPSFLLIHTPNGFRGLLADVR